MDVILFFVSVRQLKISILAFNAANFLLHLLHIMKISRRAVSI